MRIETRPEQRRLKFLASINDESLGEDTDPDWEMRYVDISNVDSAGTIHDVKEFRFEDAPSRARRIVREGDVIISTVRTYLQAIAPITSACERLIVSTGFAVVRPRFGVLVPDYCKYALREPSFLAEVQRRSVGVSYPAINASDLADIRIHIRPLHQQQSIADYLDRETARIDALIAAKERMLRLLEEKRRALITRAVTRGIDPDVQLRDSGVPWLGEVPAHWAVERLKFSLHYIEQGWSPQCDNTPAEKGEWGVLKAGCVNGWKFTPTENKRLPDNVEPLSHFEVRQGDVLMSRANTTALLGSTAHVNEVQSQLLLCDKLYRLGIDETRLLKVFFVALSQTPICRYQFEREATGASASMQNIGQDTVRNLIVPVPPLDEQERILRWMESQTSKLDAVRIATERTIALIGERRTALIAAAVTGQLAIPDLQEPRFEEEMACSSTT